MRIGGAVSLSDPSWVGISYLLKNGAESANASLTILCLLHQRRDTLNHKCLGGTRMETLRDTYILWLKEIITEERVRKEKV